MAGAEQDKLILIKPVLETDLQCSSAYGWSGGFFPRVLRFSPPLLNDRLDISEIFLKGP